MDNSRLFIPITLPTARASTGGSPGRPSAASLAEESCSRADISAMASWGCTRQSSTTLPGEQHGVALGCTDGSVYIFHSTPSPHSKSPPAHPHVTPASPTRTHTRPSTSTPTASSVSARSLASTRSSSPAPSTRSWHSSSPSLGKSALALAPHARAVSGVTSQMSKISVEALKNYVDYDDEPERLKEILAKGGVREHSIVDGLLPSFKPDFPIAPSPSSTSKKDGMLPVRRPTRRDTERVAAARSPALSARSLSPPSSPELASFAYDDTDPGSAVPTLSLRLHVVPATTGLGNGVSGMHVLASKTSMLMLQENGDVSELSLKDGRRLALLSACSKESSHLWRWRALRASSSPLDTTQPLYFAAMGRQEEVFAGSDDSALADKTRVVLLEYRPANKQGMDADSLSSRLQIVGECYVDSAPDAVGSWTRGDDALELLYITRSGSLATRSLILHAPPAPAPIEREHSDHGHLTLPNPFKTLASRSMERVGLLDRGSKENILEEPKENVARLEVGDERIMGDVLLEECDDPRISVYLKGQAVMVGVWGGQQAQVSVLEYIPRTGSLKRALDIPAASEVQDVRWMDEDDHLHLAVVSSRRIDVHKQAGDRSELLYTFSISPLSTAVPVCPSRALCVRVTRKNRRKIQLYSLDGSAEAGLTSDGRPATPVASTTLWASPVIASTPEPRVSTILPLEYNALILGYSDGFLRQTSLVRIAGQEDAECVSDVPLSGAVTSLHLAKNSRTGEVVVIGGADDGSLAFWELSSLKLLARSTPFAAPLRTVVQLGDTSVGRARGCVLCVSLDGTIAVVSLDGYQLLYLIPGADAPPEKVFVGEGKMLLVYLDGRARLWNAGTGEFWGAMTREKAEEMGRGEEWRQWSFDSHNPTGALSQVSQGASVAADAASTLDVDLNHVLRPGIPSKGPQSNEPAKAMLGAFLTPGLNAEIDQICRERLGVTLISTSVGFSANRCASIPVCTSAEDAWKYSPECSALHVLSIVSLLRAVGQSEALSQDTNTVITFYVTSLAPLVGRGYQRPSIVYLAEVWLASSTEIRQAIKTIVDAEIAGMSDEEVMSLSDEWAHHLPYLQPDLMKQSSIAVIALFICGSIASEKYSLLSSGTLSDTSKSIMAYVNDDRSPHRALALDLCARGFETWQHYVDAMALLRRIFSLATSAAKEGNVGPHARTAVLHLAGSSTALFMTTLSLEILHPQSVQESKAVMQMVAFLIRKKPLIVFPNLPRLVEAVVKSLDPGQTANREAVFDAATEILGQVVRTFPTVDFHMGTQRLAVGTSEGAIVMYDLKTATRLYVLEGHKRRPAGVSFSPDGRRLITVSLDEGTVLVWKVGSSFSSFFNPGAPPRQGGAGGEPYKSLPFNVGDQAHMTVAATLEHIRFEWPAERSVRLRIRDSTLTFSTS